MFVKLYLFLAAEILLVTANPLLQFLPQSCPICQKNCQNIPPSFQTSNINSYIPTNSVPNPLAPCQNPSDQLNQMIFNKIFKNPTLRTILDPNTKLYGQNGIEIPRQIPSTPNSVPNVINNYIIIPPELIFNGTEDINARNNVRNERRVNKNGNQNGSYARRRGNVGAVRRDNNIDQGRKDKVNKQNEERKSVQNQSLSNSDTEPKRERRKHRRKQERKIDENEGLNDSVQETQHQVGRANGSVDEGLNLEKQVSISEPISNDPNHSSLKCDICKIEPIKAISNPELEEHTQDKSYKHQTTRNGHRKGDRKIAKPKVCPDGNCNPNRRNKEEALIHDFHRKYPGIPEVVIRDLLAYLKRQMQNEQLGMPNFYYPYRPFPLTYDQLFQNQFIYPQNDDSSSRKTRQKSNRRSRNKKRKEQKIEPEHETTVKLAPFEASEVPTTTGSPINTTPTDVVSNSPKSTMATTLAELQRTSIADIIEDTTPKSLKSKDTPEYVIGSDALGTEDVVPTIFVNEIVNDYYPDFTADNHAYSKINEAYLGNPVEDRYQYTTDKNLPIEEYYRERRKYETNHKANKEETIRTSDETETTIARPTKEFFVEDTEEIHYKAPPKLEVPDFVTRNVNGHYEQNESDVYYDRDDEEYFKKYIDNTEVHKASTFSDAKTPQYNPKSKAKKVGADVETVFAKSKVVKFGYGRDYNDITAPTPSDNENEFKANEEQPTIVIAKSYPEDFWY